MAAAIETLSRRDVQTLYLEHHGWLRQVLCRRLGSTADAADLAHDAFLRILVRPVGLHPDDRPQVRAYLKKMAQGLCIDLWRRREIERAWLESVALEPESTAPSAEHQAMIAEALYNIDAMLRSLPVKAARAFILRVGCEMTEQEVADELGVSTRMIRKYLAKAMLHCMQVEMGVTFFDARQQATAGGANDGNFAIGVPHAQLSLGTEWDVPELAGLTLTSRVIYTGRTFIDSANQQSVPSWTRLDLGARYAFKFQNHPIVARASIVNALNHRYWEANPSGYLLSSAPLMAWLSVSADF